MLLKQLADYFAEYRYLPRLRDSSVLLGAIAQGLGMLTWEHESFAYAERFDAATGRYHYTTATPPPTPQSPLRPRRMRRYHGAARLNTLKMATEASKIVEEILQHLAGLSGAKVRLTLEIEAELPEGAPDHVVRTVTENSRVLKLESYGFEEE